MAIPGETKTADLYLDTGLCTCTATVYYKEVLSCYFSTAATALIYRDDNRVGVVLQ